MPKDTIERAVQKGVSNDTELESIVYETYGPGGCAIMIDCLTDSRNRTAQEMKHLLSELGLALAAPGSASWAFEKTIEGYSPKTMVPLSEEDDKKLMEILEKIDNYDDVQEVYTNTE
jgi:transcriptional/translational regulatory protein YebC/TACO1